MTDKETTFDIAAEFREISNSSVDGIIAVNAKVIAERLEAAARHDAEVIADLRNRVRLWTDRADELRLKCDELYAKVNQISGEDVANG